MPTYIAQITQADWESLATPGTVKAHTFAGADAGLKITAAIAALPVGIGGYVDATGFANPQNCTGFIVPPGVTVILAPILFTMFAASDSIRVHQGGRLYGSGANSPGATTIRPANGFNKDVIKCVSSAGGSNWWHHGELHNLRVDGNKAGNTLGHGVSVAGLAETSLVQRLNIFNTAEAGLYLSGSHSGTGSIENITVNGAGTYGIHIDQFRSGLTLKCVGGDVNPITLGITGATSGGGSITIIDLKSEGTVTTDPDPTVLISGGSGDGKVNLTLIGGNTVTPQTNKTLIRIAASVLIDPAIQIIGLASAGQTTLIDDLRTTTVVTTAHVSYQQLLCYCGGKSIRFDQDGFVVVP